MFGVIPHSGAPVARQATPSSHAHCDILENPTITPPLLCMLALGKTGEGAYSRDSDIYM